MLIQSTNKNEKIVLGLLSYTLEEGAHQTELLQSILDNYRELASKELYLYREQEQDNFIGLVGVETFQSADNHEGEPESLVIERMALLPSFRNESLGYQIFCELKERYPQTAFLGSRLTTELVVKWSARYAQEHPTA